MKKSRVIIILLLICSIIVGIIGVSTNANVSAYVAKEYSGSVYDKIDTNTTLNNYNKYLPNNPVRPNDELIINATERFDYIDEEYNNTIDLIKYENVDCILIPETGQITFYANVENEGYYNIKIKYYTVSGRSASITKGIMINEAYQFTEAKSFTLSRIWQDEFDVSDKRVTYKHDVKPSQIEKTRWNEEAIRNAEGYYTEPYLFYFEEGVNKITLVGDREPVAISTITLYQQNTQTYNEVYDTYISKNYQKKSANKITYKLQAESSFEKSSPTLSPVANYSSYKVEPYVKYITRYNTIGGTNWDVSGDWITWNIDVPESGLYQISIKALQNFNRGKQSSRILYLNGKIPFEECKNICFNYKSDWQNYTIGNEDGGYWFYLEEGTNTLTLECTIGEYGDTVRKVSEVIANLNWIYRKVIMRTGVSPSKYHDFQLKENIPGLYDSINACIALLKECIQEVVDISGERSDLISSLERTEYQLETFLESEKKIQTGLDELETNITSLGTWVSTVSSQPVLIDYIMIHGEDTKLPKPTTNFFQKLWHEIVMLVGSYGADTSLESSVECDGPTIEVWIMTGRDQSNLLRQLIDEDFTLQNNVNVKLKLVAGTALLPATLSGNGPDVAIGVGQSIPVNWGIRNSVVDLTQFSDYDEIASMFYDSAITPFTFDGKTYALPDTQDFLVQFVRKDIFEEFDLVDDNGKVVTPTNWDEVIDILPILQRQYLDYYLPNITGALSPLLYAMVEQYGGRLYLNNGSETGMMEEESAQAFYDFVNFYRNYGFAIDANFSNRFRTGEMPVGVANFSLYNTLSVSAPEIRGNWEFSLLPGSKLDDGTTKYASTSTATGTIMLAQTKELEASWKFMKWWLGEDAQTGYARGMEAILGAAARYNTANKAAFANLPWSTKDYRLLEEQRQYAVGVPVVPGDYIVGRYIDNAFRQVINDDVNPSDSLFNYCQKINAELERKRKEFNLG